MYKITEGQSIELQTSQVVQSEDYKFSVRPNPIGRKFEVIGKTKIENIQIYDSTGRIVPVKADYSNSRAHIQILGDPPSGNYFLRINYKNGAFGVQPVMIL
jgi:hypothetical protein